MKKNEERIPSCGGIEVPNRDTELVFILDRSGSMAGFEEDTVGGFNAMLEKQKNGEGQVYVSTVLFANRDSLLHDRLPIASVEPLSREQYVPCGGTALLDAVGGAIEHIRSIHKYVRAEDVPAHTIFVITTDGMENASHIYTAAQVKHMIREQTERCGWEFIFVAADIDAIETADSIGIRASRAAGYRKTKAGCAACYDAMSDFVSLARAEKNISDADESWKAALEEDEE